MTTRIETERLLLRKPEAGDVDEIYARYATDETVCRYLAWPRHQSIADTRLFLQFSDAEWEQWPAGPFLIFDSTGQRLLGSTGLAFESKIEASTGYVIARDSWGQGIATEAVQAMRRLAAGHSVERLYAFIHPDNHGSRRVLEKAGFEFEGPREAALEFPNLEPGRLLDVIQFGCRP